MTDVLSHSDAIARLVQWGWIPKEDNLDTYVGDKLSAVVARYQQFHGLKVDGDLGPVTASQMMVRRCGVPDQAGSGMCQWPMKDVTASQRLEFSSLSAADCKRAYQSALDSWNAVCGIRLVLTEDFGRANIFANPGRIDGRSGTLAWSYLPCGANQNSRMEQKYDTGESWTFNFLKGVAAHEIGHALGLSHSSSKSDLMAPIFNGNILTPQAGDIREVVARYGKPTNPPPVPPTGPTDPGEIPVNGTIYIGVVPYQLVRVDQ